MNIKENAKKGLYSSVIGTVLILSAIVSVFAIKEVTWGQATTIITLGLGLIGLGKK